MNARVIVALVALVSSGCPAATPRAKPIAKDALTGTVRFSIDGMKRINGAL